MPSSTATWKRPAWATPRPPSTTPRSLYPSPTPLLAYHLLLPLASSGEVPDQGRLSPQPPPSQRTIPGPSRPSRRPFFEQCRNASLEEEKQRERWTRVFRCVENEFCVGRVIYIQQLYIHIYTYMKERRGPDDAVSKVQITWWPVLNYLIGVAGVRMEKRAGEGRSQGWLRHSTRGGSVRESRPSRVDLKATCGEIEGK